MRIRRSEPGPATPLSIKERGAIEEFLVYIEDRVKEAEPVCAKLVRLARLALADPDKAQDPGRALH
jgi:hypothetical protein